MVQVVQELLRLPPPAAPGADDPLLERLRVAARGAPLAEGLRRCAVCGAAFATPLRLREHLGGRRHCQAVAARWRASGGGEEMASGGRRALHLCRERYIG